MIDGKNFQVKESKLIEWKLTVADPGFPKWKEVKPKREILWWSYVFYIFLWWQQLILLLILGLFILAQMTSVYKI